MYASYSRIDIPKAAEAWALGRSGTCPAAVVALGRLEEHGQGLREAAYPCGLVVDPFLPGADAVLLQGQGQIRALSALGLELGPAQQQPAA